MEQPLVAPSTGFPPDLFTETFQPQLLLDPDRVWACVARQDGQPVARASLWLASGTGSDVGFIGWVAALPEARGRGLAAACTVQATNRAFELGASVASLQASPMGEHIYRSLGYEELFPYRLLGAMPPD
jgi:predicted GNAT family acetyltransferase